ncbi:MAG: hypothetical protein PF588_01865 [Candidatus Kapabacteria bacterium]|nr:hypothetical protein [Candidatus Kapabacteria bacterium]
MDFKFFYYSYQTGDEIYIFELFGLISYKYKSRFDNISMKNNNTPILVGFRKQLINTASK